MNAGVLDGPPFAGASDAALDFVDNQQDTVAVADAAQFLHEDGGSDYVSAFALYWLDEDRCHFFRRQRSLKKFVFDEAGAAQREGFGILRSAFASAIHVGIANVGHAWHQWAETPLL